MYKLTRPDGFDFYSGTINYREAVGAIIRVTDYEPSPEVICGKGLHASRNPNDCFIGAKIPCTAFRVKGIQPIARDKNKTRYQALKIIEEITDLDKLFGWKYSEAINPINPFEIDSPKIDITHIKLLKKWDSVRSSVWDSVRSSVSDFVWSPVWGSVWDSGGGSVWNSVGDSVGDSMYAYIGSLFPNIKKWEYIEHEKDEYPFQSAVDLWKQGLVPSFDGEKWRLHGKPDGRVVWEGPKD